MSCTLVRGAAVSAARMPGFTSRAVEAGQSRRSAAADILKAPRADIRSQRAGATSVQKIVKSNAPTRPTNDPAEAAIARVLLAEREARESIEHAHRQAEHIAESGRAGARALAERTERRIRAVVGAFEKELTRRLTVIDGEAARMATPHALGEAELHALDGAVNALAFELTGGAAP
jgi:hypothetical protein